MIEIQLSEYLIIADELCKIGKMNGMYLGIVDFNRVQCLRYFGEVVSCANERR